MSIRAYIMGLTGAALLFAVVPSFAADHPAQGGQKTDGKMMMDDKMMDGKMDPDQMERHKPMHEIMGMVREMMVMMKDVNHQFSPEQKAKLDGMIVRFDEIIKEHEEQMKKMKERRDERHEKRDERREKRRDKKEMKK